MLPINNPWIHYTDTGGVEVLDDEEQITAPDETGWADSPVNEPDDPPCPWDNFPLETDNDTDDEANDNSDDEVEIILSHPADQPARSGCYEPPPFLEEVKDA
ncbi:hypothetical protein BDN71DRAFT_1435420 [Pleurotus eryngii]|uniref:Uncharacterized protein n=1 Tax=Pleurotus eryngii TaxID=5323 RepID=A0A9P6D397_PLEER|nr:hypothetical protein BDN71DRAFT_1435420 [Pleurotus eryngii]